MLNLKQKKMLFNIRKLVLATDTIAATGAKGTKTAYYYVVVEFKDTNKSQNDSMNAVLNGTISVEAA